MPNVPYSLLAQLESVKDMPHPPIHLWQPDNVKDIDMRIARDGIWYYNGTPIERQRLVRLFSTVLRREADGDYYLVTPAEKCRINVEDAPFQAILLEVAGRGRDQVLRFTTNVADKVVADAAHSIRVSINMKSGEPSPYLIVRDDLEALMSRSVWYQLTELMVTEEVGGEDWLGAWSSGAFFKVIPGESVH